MFRAATLGAKWGWYTLTRVWARNENYRNQLGAFVYVARLGTEVTSEAGTRYDNRHGIPWADTIKFRIL
jgi:hypothetical protein